MIRSTFPRFLLLACGLLLALPPGWCCMVPAHAVAQETRKSDDSQPRSCCGHSKEAPKPAAPEGPKRAPLPFGRCPCCDRTTSTDAPKTLGCDQALAAPLPLIVLAASPTLAGPILDQPVSPFDHSLQLIHCVWLC
jgi:hypothetical protein